MPSSSHARITRTAISPRLAMRILLNTAAREDTPRSRLGRGGAGRVTGRLGGGSAAPGALGRLEALGCARGAALELAHAGGVAPSPAVRLRPVQIPAPALVVRLGPKLRERGLAHQRSRRRLAAVFRASRT